MKYTSVKLFNDPRLVEIIIFFSISYNFFLSIINAHIADIHPYITYTVEFILIFLSLIQLSGNEKKMIKWIFYSLMVINGIDIIRILLGILPDLKFYRDTLIEYAFLALGLSYHEKKEKYLDFLIKLSLFIAFVSFIELKWTSIYEILVNPRSYYIAAKNFSENSFWNVGSKLFLSANRPDQRFFFPNLDLIRSSSIFIEPVTMGNFIIFFSSVCIAFYSDLSKKQKLLSSFLVLFLIIAADSRLAFYTLIILLFSTFFSRIFKRDFSILIAFFIIFAGVILHAVWHDQSYQDNFIGRISYSYNVLYNLPLSSWLGFDQTMNDLYWDSGLSYMIVSQSIFFIFWNLIFYQFVIRTHDINIIVFKNNAIIAVVLSLIVSNSFFSIKTAALWWFSIGYFWQLSSTQEITGDRQLLDEQAVTVVQ